MPALCSLITLAIVLGIAFVAFGGVTFLVTRLLPKTSAIRNGVWLASLLIGFPALIAGYYLYTTRPDVIYQDMFGEQPTADVRIVMAERFVLGDSGQAKIVFEAAPTTIARLQARWPPINAGLLSSPRPTRFGFAGEEEKLEYDPASRKAIYTWQGID